MARDWKKDEGNITRLKSILDGAIVFVVPWAIFLSSDGALRINGMYPCSQVSSGTSALRIQRESYGFSVFKVDFDVLVIGEHHKPSYMPAWNRTSESPMQLRRID